MSAFERAAETYWMKKRDANMRRTSRWIGFIFGVATGGGLVAAFAIATNVIQFW